jgi:FkbM family methyltransferase
VTSPLDGRVADINRRVGSLDERIASLDEHLGEVRRKTAANATTVAESTTYAGVELRRLGEALAALHEDLDGARRQIDALAAGSYAERLSNAARTPARSALDQGLVLSRPLALADVGCRWGIPDAWRGRGEDLRVYAFDADARECERLQALAPGGVTYVAAALGERDEDATLHVTEEPGSSSLFAPAADAIARFPELATNSEVDTMPVSLQRLDDWAQTAGVEHIDVMKLDVQGAELAVLRGAERLLDGVRLIEIEVTFNAIYDGQPLFPEVDSYLRGRGFTLWRLTHLVHYATRAQQEVEVKRVDRQFFDSAPVDFPVGAGQLTWAHAYYCAPELAHGEWTDPKQALIDACAAELFGFHELVGPALGAAEGAPGASEAAAAGAGGPR